MSEPILDRRLLIDLYHDCFPENVREEAVVERILSHTEDPAFGIFADGALAAACLLHGRAITMLAVQPAYRRKGFGSTLLNEAEQRIRAAGYEKLTIGVGTDDAYLMPGVPMDQGADAFFRKRGYQHNWGETGCFDMSMDLSDAPEQPVHVGDTVHGITYRMAGPKDIPGIEACVKDAQESFVPYYLETEHYTADTKAPVLVAVRGADVLGTLIVSLEVEGEGLGSVGCTATRTDARGQGIATHMVQAGTQYLKDNGMRRAFLGYTYTDILRMYARAGYQVSQEYFMAEKRF
ncbi:MAG: GNAT family N-acetyltransferase [Clostridiales bacterium]|nr:GNAT family N-acetyltransferase [Clostridiales bacterium]